MLNYHVSEFEVKIAVS